MGLFGKSKKEQAQELTQKGLDILGIDPRSRTALDSCVFSGKCKEAINYFDNALKLDPKNPTILFYKGIAEAKRREYTSAISCFDSALKLDPKNQLILIHKAKALAGEEKYEEAIQLFDKAIEIKSDSVTWLEKGKAQLQYHGSTDDALKSFNRASELDPTDLNVTISICDYYAKKGQFTEMCNSIDLYLSKFPDSALAWYTKGVILDRGGKDEDAHKCYLKAQSLGSSEAKGKLKQIESDKKREKDINQQLLVKESDVIGKYFGDFIEPYINAIDEINPNSVRARADFVFNMYLGGGMNDTLRTGRFPAPREGIPHAIIAISRNSLSITGKHRYSIPLENIISIRRIQDEFGNENAFIVSFGEGSKNTFFFRIRKNSEEFYTSISEAIMKRRDKIEGKDESKIIMDFSSIKEYLKNGGVVMQTFKCPGCGASLEFPDNVDTTTCQFCGNKIKAVDLFEKIKSIL